MQDMMLAHTSSRSHVKTVIAAQNPLPQRPRVPHGVATVQSFTRRHQQDDRHRTGAIAFGGVYDRVRSLDAELDDLESSSDVEVRSGPPDSLFAFCSSSRHSCASTASQDILPTALCP